MTPDSPKGPESEERLEEPSLGTRIAQVLHNYKPLPMTVDQLDSLQASFYADVVMTVVTPDLTELAFDRDAAQATADLLVQQLEDLRDDVLGDESLLVPEIVGAAGRTVERLTAEVERLRALWPLNGFGEDTDVRQLIANHRAWTRAAQAEVSRLREQLAAQPKVPADVDELVSVALNAATNRCNAALSESLDIALTGAVMDLLKSWGVSSSEAEAPQPQVVGQHKVTVQQDDGGTLWLAVCNVCGPSEPSTLDAVRSMADQHEADTLRPVSVISPKGGSNDDAPVRESVDLADLTGTAEFDRMFPPACGQVHDGEECLEPRVPETNGCWAHYGPECAAQVARSEATPEDPFAVGDEVLWRWHGDPADGPWFKARLIEKHPAGYPSGWSGEITDPGTNYSADHMGEVPVGYQIFMDVPSMTLISKPSPSLPKEGEDRG